MNVIFISPYFPQNFEPFAIRMKQKGANVFGIGDKPYHELSQSLKEALTEYYLVSNMENYDEMYRAVAYLSYKHGKIDRLESHNEYWLFQDAKLRTDFNIYGLKNEDMEPIKYKSKMKEVFRLCNIPVAKGRVFKDLEDAKALAKELNYPVIIKPDNGVGASDTYKVDSQARLEQVYIQLHDQDYIMEEFLEGSIVTFDGLVNQDGEIIYQSHFVYDRTCLDVVDNHSEMLFRAHPKIPKKLEKVGKKAIKAFGLKERFFHMEFFHIGSDYYGLEINCRPPGGLGFDVLNYANDIDLFAEYANVVMENKFTSEITNAYVTYYVSRLNHVPYANTLDDIQNKYKEQIRLASPVPHAFSNILGDFAFIFKTKDLKEAYRILNYIIEVKA